MHSFIQCLDYSNKSYHFHCLLMKKLSEFNWPVHSSIQSRYGRNCLKKKIQRALFDINILLSKKQTVCKQWNFKTKSAQFSALQLRNEEGGYIVFYWEWLVETHIPVIGCGVMDLKKGLFEVRVSILRKSWQFKFRFHGYRISNVLKLSAPFGVFFNTTIQS